jgi:hypothetical protein
MAQGFAFFSAAYLGKSLILVRFFVFLSVGLFLVGSVDLRQSTASQRGFLLVCDASRSFWSFCCAGIRVDVSVC